MPQVALTVAGYVSATFASIGSIGQTILFYATYAATLTGISYGINYASTMLLGGRAGTPSTGTTVTARNTLQCRRIIYGQRRVGGTALDMQAVGDTNPYFYMVIALAGHEVE